MGKRTKSSTLLQMEHCISWCSSLLRIITDLAVYFICAKELSIQTFAVGLCVSVLLLTHWFGFPSAMNILFHSELQSRRWLSPVSTLLLEGYSKPRVTPKWEEVLIDRTGTWFCSVLTSQSLHALKPWLHRSLDSFSALLLNILTFCPFSSRLLGTWCRASAL